MRRLLSTAREVSESQKRTPIRRQTVTNLERRFSFWSSGNAFFCSIVNQESVRIKLTKYSLSKERTGLDGSDRHGSQRTRKRTFPRFTKFTKLNEFKESFWLLDKENTGRVTIERIVNHFDQLGKKFTEEQIREALSCCETKDGVSLDLIEFMAVIAKALILTTQREHERMYRTLCLETDEANEGEKEEEAKELHEHNQRHSHERADQRQPSVELEEIDDRPLQDADDELARDRIFIHNIVATLGVEELEEMRALLKAIGIPHLHDMTRDHFMQIMASK